MLIQIEKNLKLVVLPAVFALIMSTGNLANATWVHHDGNSHRQTDQGNRHHIWPRPRPIIRPINPVEGDSANPVTGPIEQPTVYPAGSPDETTTANPPTTLFQDLVHLIIRLF